MAVVIQVAERHKNMEIGIGQVVATRGGWRGKIAGVMVESASRQVTHILVEGSGLSDRPAIVPIDMVDRYDSDLIHIDISTTKLNEMPRFSRRDGPDTLESGVAISSMTKVSVGGKSYQVHCVGIEPDKKELTHLIVKEGWLIKRQITLSLANPRRFSSQQIELDGVAVLLQERNASVTDDLDVEAELRRCIDEHGPFRAAGRFGIQVSVKGGLAELSGNVRYQEDVEEAERLARSVVGVVQVENRLVSDIQLEATLAETLARDERVRSSKLKVSCFLGSVAIATLERDTEAAHIAESIALGLEGVRSAEVQIEPDPVPWSYSVLPNKDYSSGKIQDSSWMDSWNRLRTWGQKPVTVAEDEEPQSPQA